MRDGGSAMAVRRVLHVTQSGGGVETVLLRWFAHFDRTQFEHHLCCPPGSSLAEKAARLGIHVWPLAMVRDPRPWSDIGSLYALARHLSRHRYALIHAHSAKGGFLGRLAARLAGGYPTAYSPQAFSFLSQRGIARRVFLALERRAVRWTTMLVASSDSEAERAIREVGFPRDRVTVVPNSIDWRDSEGIEPLTPPSAEPLVLSVGRLAFQKNPQMFLRAARRILDRRPGIRFGLYGGGYSSPLDDEVKELVRHLRLESAVTIVPWTDAHTTLRAVAGATVLALTSRFEGMPNVLLEGMMLGVPVVATDADGNRDVVRDGDTGFLVPQEDDAGFAERVLRLVDNPQLARRLGENGRARARREFEVKGNVKRLESLYGTILASASVGR